MPKKLELPTVKRTLNLYKGDQETLERFYPKVGWSVIARQLIHLHAKRLLEKESRSEQLNDRTELDAIAASFGTLEVGDTVVLDDDGDDQPDLPLDDG